MELYVGIDLHSNNSYVSIMNKEGKTVFSKKLPNDLELISSHLEPYQSEILAIAVESTFNWYWLVDGLQEEGYSVKLANTAAMKQYEGKKHSDDKHDARWLAEMLRLGILPEGYIYPKEMRGVRDLLRKRSQMVRQRTMNILSAQGIVSRHTGQSIGGTALRKIEDSDIDGILSEPLVALAMKSNMTMIQCLEEQIAILEKEVHKRVKLELRFRFLQTVDGIGYILGMTITLETGEINRFRKVGNFASYCRCVDSKRLSNGKTKGKGNKKNGNKYLAWAFSEAAQYAIRYNEDIRRYYQRKLKKVHKMKALNAVAHKLARASYYIMRDGVPFDIERTFA